MAISCYQMIAKTLRNLELVLVCSQHYWFDSYCPNQADPLMSEIKISLYLPDYLHMPTTCMHTHAHFFTPTFGLKTLPHLLCKWWSIKSRMPF